MIKILVDSSSELTKKEAEEKGFLFVPISVNIGGREYRDGVDLTKDKSVSYTHLTLPTNSLV